jgi:hypothetical protein
MNATAAVLSRVDAKLVVEGVEVDPARWSSGSWTPGSIDMGARSLRESSRP